MSTTYPPSAAIVSGAHVDASGYERLYARSVADPEGFWRQEAETRLEWMRPFTRVKDTDFTLGRV